MGKNRKKFAILFSVMALTALLVVELYIMINDSQSYINMAIVAVIMLVLVYLLVNMILRQSEERQKKMEELKIGILRIENVDDETGKIILTVSEDADCSGLPILGETVCNYDEGFISGVLSTYSGREYTATEVDCWATGDRVCRFHAECK